MKWTKTRYKKLKVLIEISKKPTKISNYKFISAILYIIENGYKLILLPKKYVKWHIICVKFVKGRSNYKNFKVHEYKSQSGYKQESKQTKTEHKTSKTRVTTKLHLRYIPRCSIVFHLPPDSLHDIHKDRKFINSIFRK